MKLFLKKKPLLKKLLAGKMRGALIRTKMKEIEESIRLKEHLPDTFEALVWD